MIFGRATGLWVVSVFRFGVIGVLVWLKWGMEVGWSTRDVVTTGDLHPMAGWVSTAGLLLMSGAGAV